MCLWLSWELLSSNSKSLCRCVHSSSHLSETQNEQLPHALFSCRQALLMPTMRTRLVVGKTSIALPAPNPTVPGISSHMSIPNTTSLSQVRGSSPLQYHPETNRFERLCPLSSGCGEVKPGHGTSPSNVTIAVPPWGWARQSPRALLPPVP